MHPVPSYSVSWKGERKEKENKYVLHVHCILGLLIYMQQLIFAERMNSFISHNNLTGMIIPSFKKNKAYSLSQQMFTHSLLGSRSCVRYRGIKMPLIPILLEK